MGASKAFRRAVEDEVHRRQLDRPIRVRSLVIDFETRTVSDGRREIRVEARQLVLPILDTEQIVWPVGATPLTR